jgi:hypothetical protein
MKSSSCCQQKTRNQTTAITAFDPLPVRIAVCMLHHKIPQSTCTGRWSTHTNHGWHNPLGTGCPCCLPRLRMRVWWHHCSFSLHSPSQQLPSWDRHQTGSALGNNQNMCESPTSNSDWIQDALSEQSGPNHSAACLSPDSVPTSHDESHTQP